MTSTPASNASERTVWRCGRCEQLELKERGHDVGEMIPEHHRGCQLRNLPDPVASDTGAERCGHRYEGIPAPASISGEDMGWMTCTFPESAHPDNVAIDSHPFVASDTGGERTALCLYIYALYNDDDMACMHPESDHPDDVPHPHHPFQPRQPELGDCSKGDLYNLRGGAAPEGERVNDVFMPREAANVLVDRIIKDLSGRKGLRQEWEQIEPLIQAEIEMEWGNILQCLYEAAPATPAPAAEAQGDLPPRPTGRGKLRETAEEEWQAWCGTVEQRAMERNAKINTQAERIASLEADLNTAEANLAESENIAAERKDTIASLEAAVVKYGSHHSSCRKRLLIGTDCDCGFDAALAGKGA